MIRPNATGVLRRWACRNTKPALVRTVFRPLSSNAAIPQRCWSKYFLQCQMTRVVSPILSKRRLNQTRQHSQAASRSRVYEFNDIKSLSEQPSEERILIDVREPNEYNEGYIPTAINLPIKSQPDALVLPADEFEDRYGFAKPGIDQEVVFYCRSGVRSSAAAQLAEQIGYKKIGEYRGSWLDWAANGGKVGR